MIKKTEKRIKKYGLQPLTLPLSQEAKLAKEFWANHSLQKYYEDFQPQTGFLLEAIKKVNFKSILEFGCNVGRNLYWIKERYPNCKILGLDINKRAIEYGRKRFGFKKQEIIVADENYLNKLPTNSFDIVFTVSTLDHLPQTRNVLKNLVRIAKERVFLIELTFPKEGAFVSKKVVPFSYSHNYLKLFKNLSVELVTKKKTPLGKKILKYYYL